MDWFLYDRGLRHERVKELNKINLDRELVKICKKHHVATVSTENTN